MSVLAVSNSSDRNLTLNMLRQENQIFLGTGGVSQENRQQGFRPAFRDDATGKVYVSTLANGRPAPFHLLDG